MELELIEKKKAMLTTLVAIFLLGIGMNANASWWNTTRWKEEVLLHDGTLLMTDRWETVDPAGRREIGQQPPTAEAGIRFVIPGTRQTVTWKSDFGRKMEDNLALLMLGFRDGVPYVVTKATGCAAYNRWGRPNPPYVFFKFDGTAWQRISLQEFPAEFQKTNVLVSSYTSERQQMTNEERDAPFVTAKTVKRFNSSLRPHLRLIARKPLEMQTGLRDCPEIWSCEELIFYKGSWILPNDSLAKDILDGKK